MINPINTASHPAKNSKQGIIKYTTAGIIGAAAGVGVAYIPRDASPVANKAGRKFALARRLKRPQPFKFAIIGLILTTGIAALTDYIKSRKGLI